MAIETQYLPDQATVTSLQILKEFILTYISSDTIDITFERPTLDENYPLSKPILYFEIYPGSDRNSGLGRKLPNGDKGIFTNMSVMVWIIVDYNCGEAGQVRSLSDSLRWMFLNRGFELSQAGLKDPVCGTLREIPKESYTPFFGGRCLISYQCLISW